jgi:DNA-binding protein Fis
MLGYSPTGASTAWQPTAFPNIWLVTSAASFRAPLPVAKELHLGRLAGRMRRPSAPVPAGLSESFQSVRALLRADSADDELAHALAKAGLYVERLADPREVAGRLSSGDVAVVDPRLLAAQAVDTIVPRSRPVPQSLESICYERLNHLLERLADQRLPALYETAMAQMERALLRVTTERSDSLKSAAEILGIHRNTLVRRLEALGLRQRPAAPAPASRLKR